MTELEALHRLLLDAKAHHATAPVLTDESKQAMGIVEGLVATLQTKQHDKTWVMQASETALASVGLVAVTFGSANDVREAMKDLLPVGKAIEVPEFTDRQIAEALDDVICDSDLPSGFSDWLYDRSLSAAKDLLAMD